MNGAVVRQIRAEIAARGLTIKALAEKAEMNPTVLGRYLDFKRGLNLAVTERLASALDIAGDVLVERALTERSIEN